MISPRRNTTPLLFQTPCFLNFHHFLLAMCLVRKCIFSVTLMVAHHAREDFRFLYLWKPLPMYSTAQNFCASL